MEQFTTTSRIIRMQELSSIQHLTCLLYTSKLGLDKGDRSILETMIDKFDGGPVGLDTLAAALGEDSGTLEDVYEPYLIQNGLLQRTPCLLYTSQ